MRLGLIARADNGGLGAMTWEFYRHLQPERVLGVDLGEHGRGPSDWSRYPGAVVNQGMDDDLSAATVRRFCQGLDVVYTAETFYRADVAAIAREVGCRTVLHAMPELWRADQAPPDVVWAPTAWQLHRLPDAAVVMPVPVDRDRLPFRRRDEARVLYHCGAPAMFDRNGTRLLYDALRQVDVECRMLVSSSPLDWPPSLRRVTIEARPPQGHYFDVHPEEADVLLIPRRYAGLSLPMQECASMGMAVVTLDLEPQRRWVHPAGLVPAYPWRQARFPGGEFTVFGCSTAQLAVTIERLLTDRTAAEDACASAAAYATTISWDRMAPRYRAALEAAAG